MSTRSWSTLGRVQLVWFLAVASVWSLTLLGLPVDPDYTAGELADHLASWAGGAPLYPSLDPGLPLRVLNYPPLAFVLGRGLVELGASPVLAGRLVNGAGLLAVVGIFVVWGRSRGLRGATLAGTVGLLGASFPVLYAAGQFHIELWAAAWTLAGFALLDGGRSARATLAAGLCLGLACFFKQTQVVPAAAGLGWLAWAHGRRRAGLATAAFVVTGVTGSLAILGAFGWEAWQHMLVYTVGTYSLANLGFQAASHLLPWAVFLAFAAVTAWRSRSEARADPLPWLMAAALLWSLSAARVGSSYPYFLDLHLATALWVGPWLFGGTGTGAPRPPRPWLRTVLLVQLVGANLGVAAVLGLHLREGRRVEAALPVLCEAMGPGDRALGGSPGLVRACGKEPLLHPFIMSSLARQELWDPTPIARAMARGAYGPVVLSFDPRNGFPGAWSERWHPVLRRSLRTAPSVSALPAGHWKVAW